MKHLIIMLASLTMLTLMSPVGAKDLSLVSDYRRVEITIDGDAADWNVSMAFLEKEKIGFAVQSDSQYIYLCIKPDGSAMRSYIMTGFTVWFDASARNKKTLGIRFPIGRQRLNPEAAADMKQQPDAAQAMANRWTGMLNEIEIIGPEKDDLNRLPALNQYGIQAQITGLADAPVYELKVPLHSSPGQPYAVGAGPGEKISLGFESGKFERPQMGDRMGGRGGMGGQRPGGMEPGMGTSGGMGRGGRGGMRPGGMEGGRPQMPDPVKVWCKVQLAEDKISH